MEIHVGIGTGAGTTELSAFDSALNAAGVANFNLIRLSSVIPPQTTIHVHDGAVPPIDATWGDKLYVVQADYRTSVPGTQAWAGVGWAVDPITKKGLFVEHEGESEVYVRDQIKKSLATLMETRGVDFGQINMQVTGITCYDKPVGATVVAVYQARPW